MLTEKEILEFKYLAREYSEEDNMVDYDELGTAVYNEELYYELLAMEDQINTDRRDAEEHRLSEVNNVIQMSNKYVGI